MRKDVEDVFGILKHRFRYMKRAIEQHNQDEIGNMFFTCCILNNVLLKYDGHDKRRDDVIWKDEDPDGCRDDKYDGQLKQ